MKTIFFQLKSMNMVKMASWNKQYLIKKKSWLPPPASFMIFTQISWPLEYLLHEYLNMLHAYEMLFLRLPRLCFWSSDSFRRRVTAPPSVYSPNIPCLAGKELIIVLASVANLTTLSLYLATLATFSQKATSGKSSDFLDKR